MLFRLRGGATEKEGFKMSELQWRTVKPFIEKWLAEIDVKRSIENLVQKQMKLARKSPPFPRRF